MNAHHLGNPLYLITSLAIIFLSSVTAAQGRVLDHHQNLTQEQLQYQYAKMAAHYFSGAFEADVTGDGYPEIFVGFLCNAQNPSCEYLCFKNNGDGTYSYSGVLNLKEGFFAISDSVHNGFNDIIMYLHCTSGKIYRLRYEVRMVEYLMTESTEITPGDMLPVDSTFMTRLNW